MKLYGKCETPMCGRYGFFIRKRKYKAPIMGVITSKAETCGQCHRRVKKMLK